MNRITTQINAKKGISAEYREVLTKLHRYTSGLVTVQEAEKILELPKGKVTKLLPYLASSGWLKRIKRGLYLLIPLEAMSSSQWTANDWLVATKIFAPCYIGGWNAAHHWGFTDQLFNSTVVFSSHRVRKKETRLGDFSFIIHTVKTARFFGIETIWQGQSKILVSDPSRTIVDILDTPSLGGGIRHCLEILNDYFSSKYSDEKKLLDYTDKFNNKAIVKRLGFLIEEGKINVSANFIEKCQNIQNRGFAYLDPSLPHSGKKNKRWNLIVNANINDFIG
ncbi:type IV toxin-antitoxin system AbiEi family antitoxin domain-containing protein [Patescibacteria group bacterium]|nr:type IV toxin-antitoxin system AbiEi family antitoxin domain-containing protein [Patescibacteria group bacterium]MBU1015582.1 type IV toxin-antitoxin system AbiEi family antitoxin domain-containing protein [Patescibacteria group bacterium]MBU1684726.1 type IV toxin-antitoxin system AbiEi family antitoxin domain-containing protein [Patescibacteria group bacterium]MBU1938285.1 type IV toxin-antitoxin system AbiEi family antitoxin domain-containing protein [Patescibacteria group bacterium]